MLKPAPLVAESDDACLPLTDAREATGGDAIIRNDGVIGSNPVSSTINSST